MCALFFTQMEWMRRVFTHNRSVSWTGCFVNSSSDSEYPTLSWTEEHPAQEKRAEHCAGGSSLVRTGCCTQKFKLANSNLGAQIQKLKGCYPTKSQQCSFFFFAFFYAFFPPSKILPRILAPIPRNAVLHQGKLPVLQGQKA